MRYFGSKSSTLSMIKNITNRLHLAGSVCDPFGGIGTVGAFLKANQYSVVSGDILTFAYCFQVAKVGIHDKSDIPNLLGFNEMENYFNALNGVDGWFVEYYANERKYFTVSNAQKIQTCIDTIWEWYGSKLITEKEFCLLIASLINSMDRFANTAGTYYAYLKNFNRKSLKPFEFLLIEPTFSDNYCEAFLLDAIELVKRVECDILYLDPPYNSRDYSQYYHLPEVLAKRIVPTPHGVSGVHHLNYEKSNFLQKAYAGNAFCQLIDNVKCKSIIFHYSDDGLIQRDLIFDVLSKKGKVSDYYCESKGYSINSEKKNTLHHIYEVVC